MGPDREPADTNPYADQTSVNTHAPWLGDGTPVDVDLDGLREYAKHMAEQQRDLASRATHLTHLLDMPFEAWAGKVLGEAAFVRDQMTANASELSTYLRYLGQTLFNIGSAAQTVADSYQSADGTSAASLNAVLFAFGDKHVPRPNGLPSYLGQTYSEALLVDDGKTPTPEDSPLWGPFVVTSSSPYQTVERSVAPNGQVLERVTTSRDGGPVTVTTTVYSKDGKVLSSSSTHTTTTFDNDSNTKTMTVESSRDGKTAGTTVTTTTYSGSKVTGENTVTYTPDKNGVDHETGRRTETTDQNGVHTETTTRTDKDGVSHETDNVVVGPETQGQLSPQDPLAAKYDPFMKDHG